MITDQVANRRGPGVAGALALLTIGLAAAGAAGFVVARPHILLNRFVDSGWHIAAADEYARTGVFAKDPFFVDAPPFVPFGLMEWINGWVSRAPGTPAQSIWVGLVAVAAAAGVVASALAAGLVTRNLPAAAAGALAWTVLSGRQTLVGLGLPFAAATPWLFVAMAVLWRAGSFLRLPVPTALILGVGLGLIFDWHALVGLVGAATVAVTAFAAVVVEIGDRGWLRTFAPLVRNSLLCSTGFVLTAWRWLALQWQVHPLLAVVNAHNAAGSLLESYAVWQAVLAGAVLLGVALHPCTRRAAGPWLAFSLALLLPCVPILRRAMAGLTSEYMAGRLPLLAPIPVALALAVQVGIETVRSWRGVGIGRTVRPAGVVAAALAVGWLLRGGGSWLLIQRHLWLTEDFDRHEFAFLGRLSTYDLRDRLVLSDPRTSYFVRTLLGAKGITVMPGVASPAVDYRPLDEEARVRLRTGPEEGAKPRFAAVIITRRARCTESFAGVPALDLVMSWSRRGWRAIHVDEDGVLLLPPEAACSRGRQ